MKVGTRLRTLSQVAVAGSWLAIGVSVVLNVVFEYRLIDLGREDLAAVQRPEAIIVFALANLSATVVGSALVLRRPGNPVGWLFLALGLSLAASGPLNEYAAYGGVARPGSLPVAGFVATLGDIIFIPWLVILGLVLLLTPSGVMAGRATKIAAGATVGGGCVALAAALLRPYRGVHAALGTLDNPLAPTSLAGPLEVVGVSALVVLHVGLLMAAGLVVVRSRSASRSGQTALRWLALAAIPFPFLLLGAWVAAATGNEVILAVVAGSFVAIIPIGAGLAIEKDHLYDVDRLLSRGLTYSILTAGLIAFYALVVVLGGQLLGEVAGDSRAAPVVATFATVSVVMPARRRLQATLDRRFNRRQYEATAAIRRFVREQSASITIEQALREALDDPRVMVGYWIGDRERWVDERGTLHTPGASSFAVTRRGATVATISFDPVRTAHVTIRAVVSEALSELENAGLRAAIALQLVEVRESRARIVAAQVAERRKLERNLHDGAQQRLLAIALQLRAAQLGEDPGALPAAVDVAVGGLQSAVGELRELANGLRPATLADGGLAAALDDLAARTPVPLALCVTPERFTAAVEDAAWYIVCEAVTNAVKHAAAKGIGITATISDNSLRLLIEDDGKGGAAPLGTGLRGITDRAEAAGGKLAISDRPGGGTSVMAELPCGS